MHVAFKLIVPSGEDELKQDVVVSCIKALHKIHYIEGMFGCLIFFFSFSHEKSPDVFLFNAAYIQ